MHRNGQEAAGKAPGSRANGKALLDLFERWRTRGELDEAFADNVASARAATEADRDADPWR